MVNTADFHLHQGFMHASFPWPFDPSQQVKSVIPKYSRKQNGDQNTDHVIIIQ